jgi:hypothetical protein
MPPEVNRLLPLINSASAASGVETSYASISGGVTPPVSSPAAVLAMLICNRRRLDTGWLECDSVIGNFISAIFGNT